MTDPPHRKPWLDWQRGAAVLFMVEVHVLDAWLAPAARSTPWPWGLLPSGPSPHAVLQMIGGFAAPGVLFMAGLSQGLADRAQERRGVPPWERRRRALRRALWLLGVAYGFRVAEYVLGGAFRRPGGWADILRVDVLNVIAVGLGLSALLAVGRRPQVGAVLSALTAAAIVFATPPIADVLRHHDVAGGAAGGAPPSVAGALLDVLRAYLYASWPRANFHLFNWAGFLLAGAALAPLAAGRDRPLVWLSLAAGLFALGAWADTWPDVYRYQSFWRTSPSWFAMRLAVCLALAGLLQLVPAPVGRRLGWLGLMGRQSLVGYVASVELTYGAALDGIAWRAGGRGLRGALPLGRTIAAMIAMIALTWVVSLAWDRFGRWRARREGAVASVPAP